MLTYAHVSLRAPMIHAFDRAEREAAEEYLRHPPPPSIETSVDNPYGIGEYLPEVNHPVGSLIYGPVYLVGDRVPHSWRPLIEHCHVSTVSQDKLVDQNFLRTDNATFTGSPTALP
jgi:hypothetical protein